MPPMFPTTRAASTCVLPESDVRTQDAAVFATPAAPASLTIAPKAVGLILGTMIALFVLAHATVSVLVFGYGATYVYGLVPMFYLNNEINLPSLYSTLTLLLCAVLLAILAWDVRTADRQHFLHWAFLAVAFVYLGYDEYAQIHEKYSDLLDSILPRSGYLRYAWVVPYGIATTILAVAYTPWLARLPRRIARLFAVAAALYVGGALGLEMLGGRYASAYGERTGGFAAITGLEEGMEMAGVALFVYALLEFLVLRFGELRLTIGTGADESRT